MNLNCTPVKSAQSPLSSNSNHVSVANPLCIILVKNGSKGDRLLFRYPYSKKNSADTPQTQDTSPRRRKGTTVPSAATSPFASIASPEEEDEGEYETFEGNSSTEEHGSKNESFTSATSSGRTGSSQYGGGESGTSPSEREITLNDSSGGGGSSNVESFGTGATTWKVSTPNVKAAEVDLQESDKEKSTGTTTTDSSNETNLQQSSDLEDSTTTTTTTTTTTVSATEKNASQSLAQLHQPVIDVTPNVSSTTQMLSPVTTNVKSTGFLGGTAAKSLFDTPLSQLSSKSFTPSPAVPGTTPEFAKMRKVSRTTAPVISRGEGENPYSVSKNPNDDIFSEPGFVTSSMDGRKFSLDGSEMLEQLSDKNLSNLLAVNSDLAERKFELKLNFVRFVGHPTLMHNPKDVRPINPEFQTSVKIFHIVFCLNAAASHSIVKCFFDLSKRLGIGLRHEEYRCGFMNQEMRKIILAHDEACTVALEHLEEKDDADNVQEKVFDDILAKSKLAKLLKRVYDDVCNTGYTFARINNWVQISFCLPHRIHILPFRKNAALVEPETIHKCLEAIRPYHALLLLIDPDLLLARFWLDSSSTIARLVQIYSPLKSLQTLAADADLTLSQVVEVASHLVYWAHATVIYPLCESNVYFLAPDTPIDSQELEKAFRKRFPQLSLIQVFSDFSLALPLGERMNPMIGGAYNQSQIVDLVTWMLQKRLLIQLHTYIYLATYLDSSGGQEHHLDQISVNVDPDINLNLNLRPFDFPEEDDITVSDTYSEITGEEAVLNSSLSIQHPQQQHKQSLQIMKEEESEYTVKEDSSTEGIGNKGDSNTSQADSNSNDNQKDRATQNNNNEEVVEPLDKFKSSLPELNNESVKQAVAMVSKASISVQDIKMFSRLAKYFTGEFHVEEIMYRENVRRSQLMLLLDKFRECLIIVEKEDADVCCLRNTKNIV